MSKAFQHGFYWPTALQEAEDLVQKCNRCPRYAHQIHQPASVLKTIPLTWPFAVWGLDMVVGTQDLSYTVMLCVLVTLATSDTGVTNPRPEHHQQAGRN
jgi:hypothetical protein